MIQLNVKKKKQQRHEEINSGILTNSKWAWKIPEILRSNGVTISPKIVRNPRKFSPNKHRKHVCSWSWIINRKSARNDSLLQESELEEKTKNLKEKMAYSKHFSTKIIRQWWWVPAVAVSVVPVLPLLLRFLFPAPFLTSSPCSIFSSQPKLLSFLFVPFFIFPFPDFFP